MSKLLPEKFRDLEFLVDTWCLRTERARNNRRISSEMADLRKFYDTMLPRIDEILNFLSQFKLADLPEDVERLFLLTLMMAEAAPAVEFYGAPAVPDTFDAERFVFGHDVMSGLYPSDTRVRPGAPRKT